MIYNKEREKVADFQHVLISILFEQRVLALNNEKNEYGRCMQTSNSFKGILRANEDELV